MPVKLLHPLRFIIPSSLSPVARCLPIKLRPPVSSSAAAAAAAYPILSRAFTFKLNYRFVGDTGLRRFSTRPDTPGADSRASKSLIDDEADLDSWVSSLTGPGRMVGEDSGPGSDRNRSSTTGTVRDRDSGFKRPRDGGDFGSRGSGEFGERNSRAKVSNFGTKPPFGSERKYDGRGRPGDFKNSQRGSWGNKSNPERRSRFGSDLEEDEDEDDDDDDEDEDDEELYKSPAKGGLRGMDAGRMSRGGRRGGGRNGGMRTIGERDSRSGRRSRFGSDLDDDDDEDEDDDDDDEDEDDDEVYKNPAKGGLRGMNSGRMSRGGRRGGGGNGGMRTIGERGSRSGRRSRFGSDLEDDDDDGDEDEDDEEVYKSPKKGGFRGMNSGPMSRGGRGGGWGNGGMRTNGERGSRRGARFASSLVNDDDDEEEEEPLTSLKDLVSEDSASDDSEEDADFDQEVENGRSLPPARTKAVPRVSSSPGGSDSYLSDSRFDQCSISPLSLKAIKDAGYEKMTIVQEATLPVILKGKDVLAKARTGTGKTVAFLLPSIEVIVKEPPAELDQRRPPITVLVICPTRELASQAATEANTLLKYHPSIGVQVVIGGTRLALEQKRMQTNPCQILVATPGRLKDHIENTPGFGTRLRGVKVLVLDEADHLLDMGFRKDIERIIGAVPKQRQTLLFSATVPAEVRQICHIALKRDHEFINTVEEGSEETHSQVKQMHLIAPLDKQFSLLYALLKEHISDDVDYKVLVFCTTAMVTKMVADFLGELHLNVREIHSRKPQSYRTRISDEFRKSKGLILVTSDVSARGVDYPDVTLVIQVGAPSNRQQYVHRLGRTGRKGKEGQGILLLAPWEEFFLSAVKDLPLTKAPVPMVDPDLRKKVERALSQVEMKNKEAAYQAWLGYYNSNQSVGRDKCRLVELASDFSRSMGLDIPPAIPKIVLGKMGLKNVPGLRSK